MSASLVPQPTPNEPQATEEVDIVHRAMQNYPDLPSWFKYKRRDVPLRMRIYHTVEGNLPDFLPLSRAEGFVLGQWIHGGFGFVHSSNIHWLTEAEYSPQQPKVRKKRKMSEKALEALAKFVSGMTPEQLEKLSQEVEE
jgi:hypothetical protein